MDLNETDTPSEQSKRKLIDEMEWLAGEAGMPFRREEEHLEIVIGGIELAVETSARETVEALDSLRELVQERAERLEKLLQSISYALWAVCVVAAFVAFQLLT